jgi:endonuclease YncB( thermonuclease family)
MLGQVGIWFAVALAALLGVGMVGAIAAPKQAAEGAVAPAADTTVPSATTLTISPAAPPTTALSTTTAVQTIPTTVVPPEAVVVMLTAEIVDGDTIKMSDGSTVRLIGIDTPERGQCGFDESSAVLAQLIVGQNITLVPGARDDVDKYGRLLRYVEVSGVDANLEMIESGRAVAKYDGRDGYGAHARQDAYVQADELSPSTNICAAVAVVPVAVVPLAVVPLPTVPVAVVPVTAAPAAVYYQNCDEVRAAGAAPIRAGDPGWQTKFDRDDDGVGCE